MKDIFEDISYAYIEFYVGMAKMVAYWHIKAMGFELVGYRGPETGVEDVVSFLLRKGNINLIITSAAKPSSYEILSFVDRHGNGVKRIAYHVPNASEAYATAIERGGIPYNPPERVENGQGYVEEASIKLLDRKELVFYDGSNFNGLIKPGFEPYSLTGFEPTFDNQFLTIDHIAYGLHLNEMSFWCNNYFQKIFGGDIVQDIKGGDVITEYSGLLLRLLSNSKRRIHNVFVEPQNRKKASQVQEYLEAYYGAGVQHMAFTTNDIFTTVKAMRKNGADFVTYPKSYYNMMRERAIVPPDLIDKVEDANVLCDPQNGTYLFQTFTKPFGDRPTFFYEVIQRTDGYEGFALDSITELFKAVEREQNVRDGV